LIPKALIDERDTCQIVVANETVAGNTTSYEHEYYCYDYTKNTDGIFYNGIMWYIRIFGVYIFMYLLYVFYLKSKLVNWGVIKIKK
jgi:hypothetical protein